MSATFNYSNTCGYGSWDHSCRKGQVQFIVSGMGSCDYCVGGHRVTVREDHSTNGTPEENRAVALFLLNKYAEYCAWHVDFKAKCGPDYVPTLQAFDSILPERWAA